MRINLSALVLALVAGGVVVAQQPTRPISPPPATQPLAPTLNMLVLQGQDAVISPDVPAYVTVEVRDVNDQPVEGADILFELPASGPSGTFAGGGTLFRTRSNLQGQARAVFTPNAGVGRFQIRVTATIGTNFGSTTINQMNSTASPSSPKQRVSRGVGGMKFWIIVGTAVAGGTAAVLATRNGTSSASTTILISPGVPVFGGR